MVRSQGMHQPQGLTVFTRPVIINLVKFKLWKCEILKLWTLFDLLFM